MLWGPDFLSFDLFLDIRAHNRNFQGGSYKKLQNLLSSMFSSPAHRLSPDGSGNSEVSLNQYGQHDVIQNGLISVHSMRLVLVPQ